MNWKMRVVSCCFIVTGAYATPVEDNTSSGDLSTVEEIREEQITETQCYYYGPSPYYQVFFGYGYNCDSACSEARDRCHADYRSLCKYGSCRGAP